jgi:hypothetical protein
MHILYAVCVCVAYMHIFHVCALDRSHLIPPERTSDTLNHILKTPIPKASPPPPSPVFPPPPHTHVPLTEAAQSHQSVLG